MKKEKIAPYKLPPCPRQHRKPTSDELLERLTVAVERCADLMAMQVDQADQLLRISRRMRRR